MGYAIMGVNDEFQSTTKNSIFNVLTQLVEDKLLVFQISFLSSRIRIDETQTVHGEQFSFVHAGFFSIG